MMNYTVSKLRCKYFALFWTVNDEAARWFWLIIACIERITDGSDVAVNVAVKHTHIVLRHFVSPCHVPCRVKVYQQLLSCQLHCHIVICCASSLRPRIVILIVGLNLVNAEQPELRNHSAGCCCSLDSHHLS